MSRNSGKALWIKEKIPVYEKNNGIIWKNNEDLKVGNYVLDEYAEPTKITHINPIIIEDEYIVSFKSGEEIHCNSEHLWNVYDRSNRKENIENRKLITISTEEMAKNYTYKNGYRFLNPVHNIKQENSEIKNFEIEPYLLGLWLGDGNKNSNKITSDIKDIDEEIKILNIINKNGWIFKKQEVPNKNYGYINIEHPDDKNRKKVFTKLIRSKSLYENKNIPNEYFLGNYEQKMDLLRGLMDSDGNCNKQTAGNCFFVQKDISISNQMCHLLALLGIKYSIYESDPIDNRSKKQSHRCQVFFKSEKSNPCFYLKRKCSLLADSLDSRNYVDAIISIKKTGKKIPMRCITVSNESGCFLCGEHMTVTHNSYLSSPLMMARALLIPNTNTYIMAPSGGQAQETFGKMESLSKNQIASVLGVTSVFLEETIRQNAGTDPFVHDKNSYHVELYNGSTINTLNSVVKNIVGIRSNFSIYEEAGKIDRTFYALTQPFSAQDTNFITGGNLNSECYPIQLPNKKLFMSSAEGIDSELYDQYKMSFEKMMCGDPNYFVCDIDCEQSIYPKKDGKPFKSLVTKETVEQAMATNPYKATREYYNKFDRDGGTDNLVKRSTLEKLSQAYLPSFKNEDNNKKYVITYDPASRIDNSVILVGEFFRDEEKGWMAKIVHCVNLIEVLENGEKVVIQKPEQIKILKDLILAYNGKVPDYENLLKVMIDGGSGGGGFEVAQEILPEWKGKDGRIHRGFIDLENEHMKKRESDYVGNCLNLEIFNFTKNKVRAYENTQNMINQGLMIFPKSPNIRGELENEITNADGSVALKYDKLSAKEFNAWNQVDLLKEELIAMQKSEKNNKTIQFEISHEKKLQNMHDDHSDCCAMMCDYLARLRADDVLDVEKGNSSYDVIFNSITGKNNNNPFNNMGNPFAGLSSKNPFL